MWTAVQRRCHTVSHTHVLRMLQSAGSTGGFSGPAIAAVVNAPSSWRPSQRHSRKKSRGGGGGGGAHQQQQPKALHCAQPPSHDTAMTDIPDAQTSTTVVVPTAGQDRGAVYFAPQQPQTMQGHAAGQQTAQNGHQTSTHPSAAQSQVPRQSHPHPHTSSAQKSNGQPRPPQQQKTVVHQAAKPRPQQQQHQRSLHSDQRDPKRRKLPNWLGEDEDTEFMAGGAGGKANKKPARNHQEHASAAFHQSRVQRAPSAPQASSSSHPDQPARSQSSHTPSSSSHNHGQRKHPLVTYLPAPSKYDLPPNFPVVYARNRAQSDAAAAELLKILKQDLEDLDHSRKHRMEDVSDSSSSSSSSTPPCACPIAIGFDLEWRPNFTKGAAQFPVALMQLSTSSRAYLFQIINYALPKPVKPTEATNHAEFKSAQQTATIAALGADLSAILLHPRILKVGIGIKGDVAKLHTDYHLKLEGMLDLSDFANERMKSVEVEQPTAGNNTTNGSDGAQSPDVDPISAALAATHTSSSTASVTLSSPPSVSPSSSPSPSASSSPRAPVHYFTYGLASLLAHLFAGAVLAKPGKVRMSNWERPLTEQQQRYAALDAYASWACWDALHKTHIQDRTCHRALDVGMGKIARAKSPHWIPIEVVVRAEKNNSASGGSSSTSAAASPPGPSTSTSSSSSSNLAPKKHEGKKRPRAVVHVDE